MITEHYLINKLANIKTLSALCSGSPELFGGCSLAQKSSAAALLLLSDQSLHRGQRSTLALWGSKCNVISDIVPGVGGAGSCCIQARNS